MKIIHTADWHLGKLVNGVHMTEDQAYVLKQFIQYLKEVIVGVEITYRLR